MYKVLLVDDEILAIQFLENLIDWQELNCQIAGTATTVRKALALARDLRPDIVFMDIKMPGMDGLEVAERILEEVKNTEIIILTAYPDFTFAKKALKLGVLDFLIKHELDEEMVKAAVKKAILELQKKDQVERMLTERWLKEGWEGKAAIPVPHRLKEYTGVYRILMVKTQSLCQKNQCSLSGEWTEGIQISSVKGSFYEKYGPAVFLLGTGTGRTETGKREQFREAALRILTRGEYLEKTSFMGIYSEEFSSIEDYQVVCRRLKQFQDLTLYQTHHLLFPEEYMRLSVIHPQWPQDAVAKLYRLMTEEPAELRSFLKQVFETEQMDFWIDTAELRPFAGLSEKCGGDWKLLTASRSVAEFLKNEGKITEEIGMPHGGRHRKVIQAEAYIREHFREDINSASIGEALHISDGYLRKIFKQERGITLKDYLQNYRIRKAREYLESGKYRISEIAQMCGFKTSQHFSTVFKNVMGKSPGAYTGDGNKENN